MKKILWRWFLSWKGKNPQRGAQDKPHLIRELHRVARGARPRFSQWKKALEVFPHNEKILLFLFALAALGSFSFFTYEIFLSRTITSPSRGGNYSEALIGQPRFLNPVLAAANDVDRDITELVFSSLVKYTSQGELVPDLAERYEITEEGKVYEFFLRKNILWHDGQPFTADDVIFTIKTIQNSDYKSPIRANWVGVQVEKIDDFGVRFILHTPYPPFLENTTQKIIPRHIWKDIHAGAFPLAYANLEPQGTGPFRFHDIESDNEGIIRSITLIRNDTYYGTVPNLKEVIFYFFQSQEDALEALKRKDVKGLQFLSSQNLADMDGRESVTVLRLKLPRTFSVFFNSTQSEILKDSLIREALSLATDKSAILSEIFYNEGVVIDSPFLPGFFTEETEEDDKDEEKGTMSESSLTPYDPEASGALLEKAGWEWKTTKEEDIKTDLPLKVSVKEGEQSPDQQSSTDSQRKIEKNYRIKTKIDIRKEGRKTIKEEVKIPLEIHLVTATSPELIKTAELLKEQWEKVGFKVQLTTLPSRELQEEWIKPRAYDALLFGQVFGKDPDPFVFWHSSQKEDPGLNLSLYENETADKLLEEARQSPDEDIRKEKYRKFAEELSVDIPAIFLLSPTYLYPISTEIRGIEAKFIVDPSKRFTSITNWYTKTKRTWK